MQSSTYGQQAQSIGLSSGQGFEEVVNVPNNLSEFASKPQFQQILLKVKQQTSINYIDLKRDKVTQTVVSLTINAPTAETGTNARRLVETHFKNHIKIMSAEAKLAKTQTELFSAQGEVASGMMVDFFVPIPVIGLVIGKGGGWFMHWMYYQNSYVWSFPRDLQRYRALEPYVGHPIHYERNSEQVTWEVTYGESAIETLLKHSFHTPKLFLAHQRPVLVRLVMVEVVVVVVVVPDGKNGRVRSGLAAEFRQCGARHCVTSKCCGLCSRNAGRTVTVARYAISDGLASGQVFESQVGVTWPPWVLATPQQKL